MARPHVLVRPARTDDAGALVRLWEELLESSSPAARTAEAPSVDAVRDRLASLADDSRRVLLVAVDEDEPVALAHVVAESVTPLHDTPAARVSYFHVSERHRRRGIGTALLSGAATWAQQVGAEHVVADCSPTARDTNRFFARLGFGQLLIQRVVPLPVLLRRLTKTAASVDDVAVRRASLRARARGTVAVVARGRAGRNRALVARGI